MAWQKIIDLPDQRFIGPYGIEYWVVRDGQVFHQGRPLRKADAASFEFMPAHHFIGRDAHAVYHAWSRLPAIDRDSFHQCGAYWLDDRAVYFEFETSLKALPGAECTTFRDLGGGYGADNEGGWYCGRRMKHCLTHSAVRSGMHAIKKVVYIFGPSPIWKISRFRIFTGRSTLCGPTGVSACSRTSTR